MPWKLLIFPRGLLDNQENKRTQNELLLKSNELLMKERKGHTLEHFLHLGAKRES